MTLGMSDFIFAPPAPASLPVIGQDRRFPVGRIFCVGRNYAAHAAEMGSEVDREAPFYFLKSLHAVQQGGGTMPYPPGTSDLHHEIELVVAIGAPAFRVTPAQAGAAIWGYGAGLDLTRRDLQAKAKAMQRPCAVSPMRMGRRKLVLLSMVVVASPGYFAGSMSLGGLMMVVNSFNQVQSSLRWFVASPSRLGYPPSPSWWRWWVARCWRAFASRVHCRAAAAGSGMGSMRACKRHCATCRNSPFRWRPTTPPWSRWWRWLAH